MTYGRAGSSPAFGTKYKTANLGGFFTSKFLSVIDINIKNRVKYVNFAKSAEKNAKLATNLSKIQ